MIAYKVWPEDVRNAFEYANAMYSNNLRFKREPEAYRGGIRFTITVNDSKGAGARRNHDGTRRISAACWHVNRDFMAILFQALPCAKLQTAVATYDGQSEFLREYLGSGDRIIGSPAAPCKYRDACECEE